MKKLNHFFFLLLLLHLFSCKKNEVVTYKNIEVDFFTSSKNYKIQPATFDTITEYVLTKNAHLDGAVFETIYEQILFKESFRRFKIADSILIEIETDSELDSISEIACYQFLDPTDFVTIDVPAQYRTITSQQLIQQGTGSEVPATYDTISRILVDTDTQIIEHNEEQTFNRVNFRIPEKRTIRIHLDYYFDKASIDQCWEGTSYRVND